MRPWLRLLWLWLSLLACLAGPASWAATPNYRALLVGVSEYPALRKDLQLEGPRNDVERMRQVLVSRGVPPGSITALADGLEGAALPTRARIMGALEQLANTARPGDYIVLLMAGHGSRTPVPPGSPYEADEPDGQFEIFLPRDVEGWGQRGGDGPPEVRNAIHDHEIRAQVDRMTAAGAFVWGIFDACHSATLVRSGGDPQVRTRQVSPADLGIPDSALQRAEARAHTAARPAAARARGTAGGASVFFYASQTTETTIELMVPPELPPSAPGLRRQGLFTYTILRALEGGASMSYQQLAQQVLARYGSTEKARSVTPLFTGTALHTGVLGQAASSVRQWNLLDGANLQLGAGQLADIREDSVLAILPSAVAKDSEAIGHVRVTRAEMASAALAPVAYGGKPARTVAELRAGRVARMVAPAVPFELAVAVDLDRCAAPCPFTAALQQLRSAPADRPAVPGAQVRWVEPGANPGVTLTALGRTLWFAPPGAPALQDCASGPARPRCEQARERRLASVQAGPGATTAGLADALAGHLHAVSRASNLMRVAGALSATPASSQLLVGMAFTPTGGKPAPVQPGQRMRPGSLRVTLANDSYSALDVNVFYIDSKHGITLVYPRPRDAGGNNRLEPGATPVPFDIDITDETLGTERLLVISVEMRKHGERADYSFLASPTLAHTVVTRGDRRERGADDETAQLLRDAGFADYATRGGRPAALPSSTGMQVFTWQVAEE